MKHKKSQLTLLITFFFTAIIIIVISAVLAPMGVLFNTKMYEAGEEIMLDAQDEINSIQNATVRTRINDVVQSGLDATENNINVNNDLFQYGWIIVLVLSLLVIFLATRILVEVSGGGFI